VSTNHKLSKGKHMKTIFKGIWNFFIATAEARYAAELARNGKWREAQEYAQR
jgi:saccharopine dehydrogenase-like NADP-dependent oxidoreductase